MKRLDDYANEKIVMANTTHAMDTHITCEVCGNTRHLENQGPKTLEDVM
jgi:Fe2+ or Zn2+ uptake regulation protein